MEKFIGKRIGAFLIDRIILAIPLIVLIILNILNPYMLYDANLVLFFGGISIYCAANLAYFLLKDSLFEGRSIGKLMLKIQVMKKNRHCSVFGSFLRNIVFIAPFMLIVELLFVIFSKDGRRIGDYIAGTNIIKSRNSKPKRKFAKTFLTIIFIIMLSVLALLIVDYTSAKVNNYNNKIYLETADDLDQQQLESSKKIILSRLDKYGFPSTAELEDNIIVITAHDTLIENLEEEIFKKNKFEVKIGNDVVFTQNEVSDICRSAQCSYVQCDYDGDVYTCDYGFAITVNDNAATRFAELTKNLKEMRSVEGSFLEKTVDLYLDDEIIDSLKLRPELRGEFFKEVSISGSGSGKTQDEAFENAIKKMKTMHLVLNSESLPSDFKLVKIE